MCYDVSIRMHFCYTTGNLKKGLELFQDVCGCEWMKDYDTNYVLYNFFISLLEKTGQARYAGAVIKYHSNFLVKKKYLKRVPYNRA